MWGAGGATGEAWSVSSSEQQGGGPQFQQHALQAQLLGCNGSPMTLPQTRGRCWAQVPPSSAAPHCQATPWIPGPGGPATSAHCAAACSAQLPTTQFWSKFSEDKAWIQSVSEAETFRVKLVGWRISLTPQHAYHLVLQIPSEEGPAPLYLHTGWNNM